MPANKIRLLTLVFFALAVLLRFAPHGVNFNAIGALALFAGCYLSATEGALLALGAMALTDTLGHWLDIESMGYYDRPTMLVVYFATTLPSLLGWLMRKFEVNWMSVFASAVGSSVLFFFITNFASWFDPTINYPRTPAGLLQCYIMALPFAGNHFVSSILFSGVFFGAYAYYRRRQASLEQTLAK